MDERINNKKRNRSAVSPQLTLINKRKMTDLDNTLSDVMSQLGDMSEHIDLDDGQRRVVKAVFLLLKHSVETNTKIISDQLNNEIIKHGETKEELACTQLELDELRIQHNNLAKKYNQVLYRVIESEMKSMENNIIISGIPEKQGETENCLRHWINSGF